MTNKKDPYYDSLDVEPLDLPAEQVRVNHDLGDGTLANGVSRSDLWRLLRQWEQRATEHRHENEALRKLVRTLQRDLKIAYQVRDESAEAHAVLQKRLHRIKTTAENACDCSCGLKPRLRGL